ICQRTRIARYVDERPTLPLVDAHRRQAVLGDCESRPQSKSRRRLQRTILAVRPAVIRALDQSAFGGPAYGQELVAAVPADVEEPAQLARPIAREKDRLRTDSDRPAAVGFDQTLRPPKAHPGGFEKMTHLPGKQVLRRVGLAGQRVAQPELGKRRLQQE